MPEKDTYRRFEIHSKIFPFPLPNTSPMLDSRNMTSSNRSSLGQRNNENLLQLTVNFNKH